MSCPQIWNIDQEKDRKKEKKRQASETQREKGRRRSRASDKKQRRNFFVGRTTWKFCSSGDKMRNASGHQCKEKMSGSEEKSEREHVRYFLHKKVSERQRQRNVQKSVLHVQSCFFAN